MANLSGGKRGSAELRAEREVIGDLLHGKETRVWGDSAYAGKREAILECAPQAKDFTNQKGNRYHKLTDEERAKNRTKSRVRAKVEHAFGVIQYCSW